jgi:hypothetical protein
MLMQALKARLLKGATAILAADEKPFYLKTGAEFYSPEDLIAREEPYLQEDCGESIKPVTEWNKSGRVGGRQTNGPPVRFIVFRSSLRG